MLKVDMLRDMNSSVLVVRKGFVVGAIAGISVAGSLLWAIPSVAPYLPHQLPEPVIPSSSFVPIMRETLPPEIAWFFIQYPYVSQSSTIVPKNHHTFIVKDGPRQRDYVVNFGQRFRRVEIYIHEPRETQIQIFTPGAKRTVLIQGQRVVSESSSPDGNLWMWKGPLWNQERI